jgi:hypothetical protein
MDLEASDISRGQPSRPIRYACLSAFLGLNLNVNLSLNDIGDDSTGPFLEKLDQLNP